MKSGNRLLQWINGIIISQQHNLIFIWILKTFYVLNLIFRQYSFQILAKICANFLELRLRYDFKVITFYSYRTVSEKTSCADLHRLCSTKAAIPSRILDLPSICLNRKLIGHFKYWRVAMGWWGKSCSLWEK